MDEAFYEAAEGQSPKSFLFTSFAKAHFGEVASLVVASLISGGRLSARDLAARLQLPLKSIKTALVSLIQMGCVLYWNDEKEVTYLFCENGFLLLIHSGDILEYIKRAHGSDAAELVQNLLIHGNIKIEDYLANIDDPEDRIKKQLLAYNLYNDGWLSVVRPIDFNPIEDLWAKLYAETMRTIPRTSTTSEIKRVSEAKERTRVKLQELMEPPRDVFVTESGIKSLHPSLVIRFSLSRFHKKLRTDALVSLARSRLGLLTAWVYESALRLIEKDSPEKSHPFLEIAGLINDPEEARFFRTSLENRLIEDKKIVFTIHDLARHLAPHVHLENSIAVQDSAKRLAPDDDGPPAKKVKTEISDFDLLAEFEAANDVAVGDTGHAGPQRLLQHHLQLLSQGTSVPFLLETVPGTFTVPFRDLIDSAKTINFENLVKVTLGPECFRVFRCLKTLRLADEKSVSNRVLLPEKAVRTELYKLVKHNMAEIQEIPRSVDRAASKTFYVFRHKPVTSVDFYCNALLHCMASIIVNVQNSKKNHKILLEKCERQDVKGHETELLLELELQTLNSLRDEEIKSIGRFNRVKVLHCVFSL